jgi:L-2,4-diaminobutyrate transaminase
MRPCWVPSSVKFWKILEAGTDKLGPIGHGWTYSAHPVCTAAGVANLKLIDQLNLVQNAGEVGAYLKKHSWKLLVITKM